MRRGVGFDRPGRDWTHCGGGRVRAPQDHVGGGASGGWRVRHGGFQKAVVVEAAIPVKPDNLARIVDALCKGAQRG
jgi:hypothetical protein